MVNKLFCVSGNNQIVISHKMNRFFLQAAVNKYANGLRILQRVSQTRS